MTNYKHRERIAFKTNTPLIHNMNLGGLVFALTAIVRGSLVISAGSANGTSLGENPNFLNRVIVEGASKGYYPNGYLRRLTPRTLFRRRVLDDSWAFLDTALTGAAGTFTLNQPYRIPFAWKKLYPVPWLTALYTDAYSGIQARFETGDASTQFSGNDRTFDFSGVTIDIMDHREAFGGTNPNPTFDDDLPTGISAANPTFTFSDFPAGANYHDVLVIAETTNQQLADTIVNRLSMDVNQVGNFDWFKEELKEMQRSGITDSDTDPGAGSGPLKGVYLLPLNPTQIPAAAIPIAAARQLKLVADVSNPGTDRLIISSRRLLAAPAKAF